MASICFNNCNEGITKSSTQLQDFVMLRVFIVAVLLTTAMMLCYSNPGSLGSRSLECALQNTSQTEQITLTVHESAENKEVKFEVPLKTHKEKSFFNVEMSKKPARQLSDDVNLRKKEFLKKSVSCEEQKLSRNVSKSIAESCALKLRVNEIAKASLDFDLLNVRLMQEVMETRVFPQNPTGRIKNILFWFEKEKPKYSLGRQIFLEAKCPVDNCQMTRNRRLVPSDQVDAIVLHSFWTLRARGHVLLPSKQKYPNAKIVLLSGEAPIRHPNKFDVFDSLVDYTMGYRRDSDIIKTRGSIYPLKTPQRNEQMHFETSSKSKMAAWFVSNCHSAPSGRAQFVSTLRRHGVRVDVFGKCGDHSCSLNQSSSCYEMLQRDYKFYFSFENSLCNHYVTEKFYNILKYNVVPVTFGLGHELTGAPKDAYIDAFDFPDAKALADHLLLLDSNATAYEEYFRWKQFYGVYPSFGPQNAFCKLCETLVWDTQPLRVYPDMQAWLSDGQCVDAGHNARIKHFIHGTYETQQEQP